MGRSRRKHGKSYADEPGREYGRSRGRKSSGAGTVTIAAAAVLLMLAGAFFFLRGDPELSVLFDRFLKASDTQDSVTETVLHTISPGLSITYAFEEEHETETSAEILNITVPVPETETETEPETLPPPKYTENENTKLIARFDPEKGASAIAGNDSASGNAVTVTFAGDILFDDHYAIMASAISRAGSDPSAEVMFDAETLSIMRSSDIFMVNNEFPYSEGGAPLAGKKFTFRARPKYAALLDEMGADIVALANNHMYDHGETALLDTLSTLASLNRSDGSTGLPYVGAGSNIEEAAAPFYFTTGNIKIGFAAATQIERMANPDTKGATETSPGVFRCLDYTRLCNVIAEMKKDCDFVIVYLHWGTESSTSVDEHQKKLSRAARDAGADLIIGDHPHVLQGISVLDPAAEGRAKVPCVYSLGNYLFNSNSQDTCLITAGIDPDTADLLYLQFIPARQEGCRTHILTGSEKVRVLEHMRSLSDASIDEEGYILLQ